MFPYWYYDNLTTMRTINDNTITMSRYSLYSLMVMRKCDVCDMLNVSNRELTRCCLFFGITKWDTQQAIKHSKRERIAANQRRIENYETEVLIETLSRESNVDEFIQQIENDKTLIVS